VYYIYVYGTKLVEEVDRCRTITLRALGAIARERALPPGAAAAATAHVQ